MHLSELQSQITRALFAPLENEVITDARAFFRSTPSLHAKDRLDIYRRSYWFRIVDSFYEDFPGLLALLGDDKFDSLAWAYLACHPSKSFTLRDLGQFLESWLLENPSFASDQYECALDMIRLEWAHIEAFDGEERPALSIAELAAAGARTRFAVQPYLRMLRVNYAVDDILIATARSNGPKQMDCERKETIHMIVHRHENSVHYLTTSQEEWNMLSLIKQGYPLEAAILGTFKDSQLDDHEQAKLITACFHRWAQFGWLCEEGESNDR